MTWAPDSSGTQTATIGTEHNLATSTTNATFAYEVDLSALVAGEVVELRVKGITLSGGTAGLMWKATYTAPLVCPRVQSPPIPSDISISVTLKQLSGTGRNFPWKLLRV